MRTMLVVLFSLCLISGIAIAKPVLEKPDTPYTKDITAVEVEPNDDFTIANPLVSGDAMDAAIDPTGDVDFFAIAVDAGAIFSFETHAGDAGDTKLYLFDVDGVTQLAFSIDHYQKVFHAFTFTPVFEFAEIACFVYFLEVESVNIFQSLYPKFIPGNGGEIQWIFFSTGISRIGPSFEIAV